MRTEDDEKEKTANDTGESQGQQAASQDKPQEPQEPQAAAPQDGNGEDTVVRIAGTTHSQKPNNYQDTESADHRTSSQKGDSSTDQESWKDLDIKTKDWETVKEMAADTPSAVETLMPYIKDLIDPEAIEKRKKGIRFRKGLHEAVEALRIFSDIGASLAGGNAYAREKPNYQQYQDELASVDKARADAMKMLFDAQSKDRDYLRKMQAELLGNSYKSHNKSNTTSNTNTEQNAHSAQTSEGYTERQRNVTNINNGSGINKDAATLTGQSRDGKILTAIFTNKENKRQYISDVARVVANKNTVGYKKDDEGKVIVDRKGYPKSDGSEISDLFIHWLTHTSSGQDAFDKREKGQTTWEKTYKDFRDLLLNGLYDSKDREKYRGDAEALATFMMTQKTGRAMLENMKGKGYVDYNETQQPGELD